MPHIFVCSEPNYAEERLKLDPGDALLSKKKNKRAAKPHLFPHSLGNYCPDYLRKMAKQQHPAEYPGLSSSAW